MNRRIFSLLAVFGLLSSVLAQGLMNTHNAAPESSITATGTGTANVPFTSALVTVRIQHESSLAATAQSTVAESATNIINMLKSANLTDQDINTVSISILPQYTTETNGSSTLTGYMAVYLLSFEAPIGQVGTLIDEVVTLGGFIDSITFKASQTDLDAARQSALGLAVDDALSKITSVLNQLDQCPGPIRTVEIGYENLPPVSPPQPLALFSMAAVSTPIVSGQGQVTSTVTLKQAFSDAPCMSTNSTPAPEGNPTPIDMGSSTDETDEGTPMTNGSQ